MNILSISICFKYRGKDNEIYSSLIDLYNIDKIFKVISDTRIIYSDIVDISEASLNYPDKNITDFLYKYMSCCKGNDNEILINILQRKTDIMTALNNVVNFNEYDKVVIYLNGHGDKGLLLPSDEIIHLEEILQIIEGHLNTEFVIITDCCDFLNDLSFHYTDNRLILRDEVIRTENARVFLMSSCIEGEDTVSEERGSPFTQHLVEFLQERSTEMSKLVEHMDGVKQDINIYASRPYSTIPSWLIASKFYVKICDDHIYVYYR